MLLFRDFPVGRTDALPPHTATKDAMLAFARSWDPQPMHTDEAAAAQSMLGGLIASGWHTAAMLMRMICDGFLNDAASMGSPGLSELRWLKPVRPGDVLSATYEVKEARASASRPGLGVARLLYTMTNQAGATVMTWDCTHSLSDDPGFPHGRPAEASVAHGRPPEASPAPAPSAPAQVVAAPAMDARGHDGFLEDYKPGDAARLGAYEFTEAGIKEFARAYDPQPFHLDDAAAAASLFGGLSASGWHTAAAWMRLMVLYQARAMQAVAAEGRRPGRLGPSPGFRDMRWLKPVRPGDSIAFSTRILGTEDWPNRPGWGLLRMRNEGLDAAGGLAFSFEGRVLVEKRGA